MRRPRRLQRAPVRLSPRRRRGCTRNGCWVRGLPKAGTGPGVCFGCPHALPRPRGCQIDRLFLPEASRRRRDVSTQGCGLASRRRPGKAGAGRARQHPARTNPARSPKRHIWGSITPAEQECCEIDAGGLPAGPGCPTTPGAGWQQQGPGCSHLGWGHLGPCGGIARLPLRAMSRMYAVLDARVCTNAFMH